MVGPIYSVAEQSLHFLTRRHDGFPESPIASEAAWQVADLPPAQTLRQPFPGSVLAALMGSLDAGPSLAPAIPHWATQLRSGRGFVLLGGLPVGDWSADEARAFMSALGAQFGILGQPFQSAFRRAPGPCPPFVRAGPARPDGRAARWSRSSCPAGPSCLCRRTA